MEFKTETRSKEQHRETAVTDVVTVIQEVHAQNTFCIYQTCSFSSSVPAKLFYFPSCGVLSHQASMSIILQSDEGHRQRGLLIITAREVKYRRTCTKASGLLLEQKGWVFLYHTNSKTISQLPFLYTRQHLPWCSVPSDLQILCVQSKYSKVPWCPIESECVRCSPLCFSRL